MLTGHKIKECIKDGAIKITPFDEANINPNSYNLTLDTIKSTNPHEQFSTKRQPELLDEPLVKGKYWLLKPNRLYIANTKETTHTDHYIPCIDGRSSIGRLGMAVHITAGFGDVGFNGTWTLEITVTNPTMVYPDDKICQIYFQKPEGEIKQLYKGKYQNQKEPTTSKMYKD